MLQAAYNVLSNYSVVLLRGVALLILTPLLVSRLGIVDYGAWVILHTLVYYLGFLDLGIGDAQVRRHAVLRKRGDDTGLVRLHDTVLSLFLLLGAAGVVVALVATRLPLAHWLDLPANVLALLPALMLMLGILNLLRFIEQALDGIYEGEQRFDRLNAIDAGVLVVESLAIAAAVLSGGGLFSLFLIYVVTATLRVAVKYSLIPHWLPGHRRPRPRFDTASWRSIRSFSLWNALNDFVTEGTAHFDKLLIPVFFSVALVTPYSLILMIAALLFVLAEPLTDTFLPKFSRHADRPRDGSLKSLLRRGTRLVALLIVPAAVTLGVFGDELLAHWVGRDYVAVPPAVLVLTVANFAFSTWLWTAINVLLAVDRIRFVFFVSVGEVCAVLLLMIWWAPVYGLVGFAAAGLVANVLFGLIFFVPAACSAAGERTGSFLASYLLRPALAASLAIAAALWLAPAVDTPGLVATLSLAVTAGAIGLVVMLAIATPRRELQRYVVGARSLSAALRSRLA